MKGIVNAAVVSLMLSLLALYGCSSGGGSEGTYVRSFSGAYTNSSGGPLDRATVELLETGDTAVTDALGQFDIGPVEFGGTVATLRVTKDLLDATTTLDLPKSHAMVTVKVRVVNDQEVKVEEVEIEEAPAATPVPTQPPAATIPPQAPTVQPTVGQEPTNPPNPTNPPSSTEVPQSPTPTSPPASTPPTAPEQPTSTPTPTPTPECEGDFDDDGNVDQQDVDIFNLSFGSTEGSPEYNEEYDFNQDGQIDISDLGHMLALVGTCQ